VFTTVLWLSNYTWFNAEYDLYGDDAELLEYYTLLTSRGTNT